MVTVSVAKAKANLSSLLDQVAEGKEIVITRHGKPVGRLASVEAPLQPIGSLAAFRKRMPKWREPSSKLVRAARDETR